MTVTRESIDIAKRIVEAASDKQASDIVLLDTRQACSFADYFVILTGESERQLEAIRQSIDDSLKGDGIDRHYEGDTRSGWLLIDIGDIIVHIFSPYEREYYQLDNLWENAPIVLRIL